jgi:hypothetical protein
MRSGMHIKSVAAFGKELKAPGLRLVDGEKRSYKTPNYSDKILQSVHWSEVF